MTIEKRARTAPVEVRAKDGTQTIGGYAAVFESPADISGIFVERIAKGAFRNALNDDVRALIDHDHGRVIGRTKAGTLRLAEDHKGLVVDIDLPDTSDGRDVATSIERGDITGMSFGFEVLKQQWDETVEPPQRSIEEVRLIEVSVVAFPAYDETSIARRSLEEYRQSKKQENFRGASKRLGLKVDLDLRERGIER